jgi:hypothetical protein
MSLQTLAMTPPSIIFNLQSPTNNIQVEDLKKNLITNVINNGLRSWFPTTNKFSFALNGLAGMSMRWRKIEIDESNGLETPNKYLNIGIAGATSIAQILAAEKGPGAVNAIGTMGFLTSEIISGRGTPGVIIGSTLEATGDLAISHPAIRPFAKVLTRQISALIQIGDAIRFGNYVSEDLEGLRRLKVEQVQKFNAILYLLRTNDQLLYDLNLPEIQVVISTLIDPYALLKSKLSTN